MIDFYEQRQQLEECGKEFAALHTVLGIESAKKEVEKLISEQNGENFWQNLERAQAVNQQINTYQKKIKKYQETAKKLSDAISYLDIVEELGEESEVDNARDEVSKIIALVAQMSIEALFKGRYDGNNAILTLHAGAGGTEAQDWVEMLYRMYYRYAERSGYKVSVIDKLDGDDAGIKSITFAVNGENAYGYLKAEMGVHRLVRISPFDANKRRHTSFASLEVMPEIDDVSEININAEDLRIDTYRSGGAGGQHVNKTDSAVRITHIPTGTVVACQNERSQVQNKERAMKMLISKLIDRKEREKLEEAQSIKGELKKIEWGSQIRSYVFCPYTLVKDHRTNYENTNVAAVMDGDIEDFIIEYLKRSV